MSAEQVLARAREDLAGVHRSAASLEEWPIVEIDRSYTYAEYMERGRQDQPPRAGRASPTSPSLARFAARERLRIVLREVSGVGVDTTSGELSELAAACVELALSSAISRADARFGLPLREDGERARLVVLGMGKLGGHELNGGSDIDLCFFYDTDEGATTLTEDTLHAYFAKVAEWTVRSLDDAGDDGMVWRTDLRLRPEGTRGSLVNSLAAAERYYENWGRTWERAALLRSTPIAGDRAFGHELLASLAPFIWRRTVDPKVPLELAALLHQARAREPAENIKLGSGGIREIEFFVQGLQLVWGGKNTDLRTPNTLTALRRLRARGFVTDREARTLEEAWHFLRQLEHRLQAQSGLPTHNLPADPSVRASLARSLGFDTLLAFDGKVAAVRQEVASIFASLGEAEAGTGEWAPLFHALDGWEAAPSGEGRADNLALVRRLEAALPSLNRETDALAADGGFRASGEVPREEIARSLAALARRPDLPLGNRTRDRYPTFVRHLLRTLFDTPNPEQAARLLVSFFSRLLNPESYAKAFSSRPDALTRFLSILGTSRFLGEALVGHPEHVDRALFAFAVPKRGDCAIVLREELALDRVPSDVEAFVGAMRRARSRALVDIGCAELAGEIADEEVSAQITELAETQIEAVADFVCSPTSAACPGGRSSFAIVALGKLGGGELGHGSDLDLIFLFDDTAVDDDGEMWARAAQKILRYLSLPHGDGPGYDLDTRLRPSGNQGLLVVSLAAFQKYHESRSATWERQALLKARTLGISSPFHAAVDACLTEIAFREPPPTAEAMLAMRAKMEAELHRSDPYRKDLKQAPGGIVDIAFAVQYAQMCLGSRGEGDDPLREGIRSRNTAVALRALTAAEVTPQKEGAALLEGLRLFSHAERLHRLLTGAASSVLDFRSPIARGVASRLGYRGPEMLTDFGRDLDGLQKRVREAFLRVVV